MQKSISKIIANWQLNHDWRPLTAKISHLGAYLFRLGKSKARQIKFKMHFIYGIVCRLPEVPEALLYFQDVLNAGETLKSLSASTTASRKGIMKKTNRGS